MKSKSYSTALLLILLFTIITVYVSNLLFRDIKQSIIAGLIVCVLLTVFEIRLAIYTSEQNSADSVKKAHEHLTTLFKVHDSYYSNDWLVRTLNAIADLKKNAEKQAHDLARFERIIGDALQRAQSEIGKPHRLETKDDELERLLRLKETVSNAKKYVYAVTFDVRDYMNTFWDKNFGSEYIGSNIESAKRGVIIKRIFVVDAATVSGADRSKLDKLEGIMRKLKRGGGNNMELYVVALEDLPAELRNWDTSFLISDDYVGSESAGNFKGGQVQGYIEYGNFPGVIQPLKERFDNLKMRSTKW